MGKRPNENQILQISSLENHVVALVDRCLAAREILLAPRRNRRPVAHRAALRAGNEDLAMIEIGDVMIFLSGVWIGYALTELRRTFVEDAPNR